jgi:hypothetical protein
MKRSMTQRSYLGWQRYWDVEPWGPWRDNVHAAIVAREVRRTRSKPNARLGLDPYMVKNPQTRQKEGEQNFFGLMQAVATAVTPAQAETIRRKQKRSRKRRK